jgi:hypothetical protein
VRTVFTYLAQGLLSLNRQLQLASARGRVEDVNSDWAYDKVITPANGEVLKPAYGEVLTQARGNAGSWMPYAVSADKERKHIQSMEGRLRASKPILSGLRILSGGVFIGGVSEAEQAEHLMRAKKV